jgi:hypothetical protein
MTNQIFKREVPQHILFDLLDKICLKTDKYYYVDFNSYKKMLFLDLSATFLKDLDEYYHISKKFYLEREFTYTSFINIIRQICKFSRYHFESETKYSHSQYYINYLVYHTNPSEFE